MTGISTFFYIKIYFPTIAHAIHYMDRVKRIWYLSPMRAAKVQASLRIRAVSPEPSLLVHTSSESRGTFRQKARSLAPLNDWACAVKICHDGMLEDTNSLDGAHIILESSNKADSSNWHLNCYCSVSVLRALKIKMFKLILGFTTLQIIPAAASLQYPESISQHMNSMYNFFSRICLMYVSKHILSHLM